jgi:proline racemase
VIGGVIHYPGTTMRAKQAFAAAELDSVRRSLMNEPRGHNDMYGGFITAPATDDGDLGILFMDTDGMMDMCGHGTIGLCTAVIEIGMLEATPPRTEIRIDTPVGRVTGFAHSENGKVSQAGFLNVPSFCLDTKREVQVDGFGGIQVGIAYGGNFFAILPAESVGLDLSMENMYEIRKMGLKVKDAVNAQHDIQHPDFEEVSGINIVTFYGPSQNPAATYKNVHIFTNGQIDRSPGGTGTSAVMAYMVAKGDISVSEPVVVEGFAGGLFGGRIVKTWQEKDLTRHTPEISGAAFITGINQLILNPADPMLDGIHPG